MKVEPLKGLALEMEFEMLEQKGKVLPVKDLLQKPSTAFIDNASAEHWRVLDFTDTVISALEIEFVGLPMKATRHSYRGVGRRYAEASEGKCLKMAWTVWAREGTICFCLRWSRNWGIPPIIMAAAGRTLLQQITMIVWH